jgi:hypothetical protein
MVKIEGDDMDRFDGNAARQLTLVDDANAPILKRDGKRPQPRLRLLQKDIYAELTRRRHRAQIAARHLLDK